MAAGSNVTCTYYNDYDRGNSAGGGGGGNNNNNPFVTTGGVFGGATTGGATTPTGTVEGANTEGGQPAAGGNEGGQVLGAESQQCSGWPLWSWILLLLVALGGFNYATWNSFKEIKVLKWFWPLVWTVAGLGTWYLYDGCRTYLWFPYTTVILAAISYLSYLYKVKQISK